MRIIAGIYRSRALKAPAGEATRPTSDRLRETLFNVLAPRMPGAAFLDLYAGSGAVGLEALSRGAARVVCVERAPAALAALRANMAALGVRVGVSAGFHVQAASVASFLRRAAVAGPAANRGQAAFEVVFLDPPYDAAQEYAATLGLLGGADAEMLTPGAVVIAEHRRKDQLADRYGSLQRTRLLQQGDASLSFYSVDPMS